MIPPPLALPLLSLLTGLLLVFPPGAVASGTRNFQFFAPPAEGTLPNGPLGRLIRQGELIFIHTGQFAHRYVGNDLTCESCHLDRGIKPYSAPLWGAYGIYPRYRKKNHTVSTLEERIQGCFRFSLNGTPPPLGGRTMKALLAYSFWVSRGGSGGTVSEGTRTSAHVKACRTPKPSSGKTGLRIPMFPLPRTRRAGNTGGQQSGGLSACLGTSFLQQGDRVLQRRKACGFHQDEHASLQGTDLVGPAGVGCGGLY